MSLLKYSIPALLCTSCGISLFHAPNVRAQTDQTIEVTTNHSEGPGSLYAAMLEANQGHASHITIAENVTGTIDLPETLNFINDVKIEKLGQEKITISRNKQGRIFETEQGINLSLKGLILTGGYSEEYSAIYSKGQLDLIDCIVTENTATEGSIVRTFSLSMENSTVNKNIPAKKYTTISSIKGEIINSSINDNEGAGAIFLGTALLLNSNIANNKGTGIRAYDNIIINNSRIIGNQGGMMTHNINMTDSLYSKNEGGIYSRGEVNIKNSSIIENKMNREAFRYLSAIRVEGGSLNLESSTVAYNTAEGNFQGVGIMILGSHLTIKDSNILFNTQESGQPRDLEIDFLLNRRPALPSQVTSFGGNNIGEYHENEQTVTWQDTDYFKDAAIKRFEQENNILKNSN